ncbi:MAG: PAS domain-containing protein [Reichenbachiella sp.]
MSIEPENPLKKKGQKDNVLVEFKDTVHGITDFNALFNSIAVSMIIVESNTQEVIEVNNEALKLFGHSMNELRSKKLFDEIVSLKGITINELYDLLQKEETFVSTLIKKNGEPFKARIKSGKISFKGEKMFAISIMDLTEISILEEAKKNLLEKSDLLNKTGKVAKIGGWSLELEPMKLKWTDATYEIHELPIGSELDIEGGINYFHPDDREEVKNLVGRCIKNGDSYNEQWRLMTAKGNLKWVQGSGHAILDGGKTIKLIGTLQDITEIKKQKEVILDNERKMTNAHQLAKIGSWEWDLMRDKVDWSEGIYEILGLSKGVVPSLLEFDAIFKEKSKDEWSDYLRSAIKNEVNDSVDLTFVHPVYEDERFVTIKVVNSLSPSGGVIKISGIVQEITDRKLLEISLNRRRVYSEVLLELGIFGSTCNDAERLANEYCDVLVNKVGFDWAWIAEKDGLSGDEIVSLADCQSRYEDFSMNTGKLLEYEIHGPNQKVVSNGETIIVENIKDSKEETSWIDRFSRIGFRSCIALPYFQNSNLKGIINLYSRQSNDLPLEKLDFLNQLSQEFGDSINSQELKLKGKELNDHNKLLIDSMHVVSVSMTSDSEDLVVSGDAKSLTGYDENEMPEVLTSYKDHVSASDAQLINEAYQESKTNGGYFDVDFRFRKKNNDSVWIKTIGKAYWNVGEFVKVVGVFIDIDKQKKSELKLVKAQVLGRDNERRRIAKEIHDSLGQLLTVANISMQRLKKDVESFPKEKIEIFNDTCDIIGEAIVEARGMSHALMPSLLMDYGLSRSIQSDIDRINKSSDIEFSFIQDIDKKRYDKDIESNIYNVTREAISNAIKYSKASMVDIQLSESNNVLNLIVEDNGVGFDLGATGKAEGIGMQNMKSRALSINGELFIESNNGTSISLEVELKQK